MVTFNCHPTFINKVAALLMIISSACSTLSTPSSGDQSFLLDEPCAAPCWYGLEPGISTEEDILTTLAELPFVDSEAIKKYGTVWQEDDSATSILFGCIHPKITDCGEALISGGKLRRLRLPPPNSLTFDSVVSKHGPPDYVSYGVLFPADCVVFLDWPDHGISVSNVNTKRKNLCQTLPKGQKIPAKTKVTEIYYFEGVTLDNQFNNSGSNMIEWPGFE